MTFASKLKLWQGNRSIPECAKILGVSENTLGNWLYRGFEPHKGPNQAEILKRMEANKEKE